MLAALAGDGLVKSATLLITRIVTWAASFFAAAITAGNAIENAGSDATTGGQGGGPPASWVGFSQGQTAAIVIALLGLVAITVSADLIARAWTTAASTSAASNDPVFLETPWQCRLDRAPDVIGTLVAVRAKDNKALFIPDNSTKAEWAALTEVKGRA